MGISRKNQVNRKPLILGNDSSLVLTPSEMARLLRIGRATVCEQIRQGAIPSIEMRRKILVPRAALMGRLGLAGEEGGQVNLRANLRLNNDNSVEAGDQVQSIPWQDFSRVTVIDPSRQYAVNTPHRDVSPPPLVGLPPALPIEEIQVKDVALRIASFLKTVEYAENR